MSSLVGIFVLFSPFRERIYWTIKTLPPVKLDRALRLSNSLLKATFDNLFLLNNCTTIISGTNPTVLAAQVRALARLRYLTVVVKDQL